MPGEGGAPASPARAEAIFAYAGGGVMAWVRLEDTFADHHKILSISDAALRLHIAGLCYANRMLTNGTITDGVARNMARSKTHINELVRARIWDRRGTGYVIHDYLDYQPSRRAVEARRTEVSKARSDAGRAGGVASGESKRAANVKQDGSPVPGPGPVPIRSTSSQSEGERRGGLHHIGAKVAEVFP